jgi:hypothetical protein
MNESSASARTGLRRKPAAPSSLPRASAFCGGGQEDDRDVLLHWIGA